MFRWKRKLRFLEIITNVKKYLAKRFSDFKMLQAKA